MQAHVVTPGHTELFDAQDEVDRQRDEFIATIEGKLAQSVSTRSLFRVRWLLE